MKPGSEAELAEAIRDAAGPLRIVGGATRAPVGQGARLQTGGLTGVVLYEPAALTLVVRAGTALAEVRALLAAEGQRLPFDPPGKPGSTIGGVVATNASGPGRLLAGACRDSLIGVRFVDGAGRIIKNGGRVMKNVTGYDLVKLMAGSWGRLGVLSEVAFKLAPIAPAAAQVGLRAELPQAVAAMIAACGQPFDLAGAAWANGQAVFRLEGLPGSVAYRADGLRALLSRFGPVAEAGDWPTPPDGAGDLWRIAVRPSDCAAIADRLAVPVSVDWGGGVIHARLPEGVDARARIGAFSGHATRLTAAGPGRFHPEPPAIATLTAALRARFDPRGILNPGE
ncbi:FAD-binding protein [Paracoccus sp. p4-l81]|uniref:FAD-binding protein n=1 Tax=Paracoccus sp. p4-l81 TaxID=3342806 RepID=UPI0035B878BF